MTELVFILDRSGSMSGLEKDTIGGFNSLIQKKKDENSNAFVSTVLFDSTSTVIHDRIPLDAVYPLTEKEYFVRGSTALLDAIGEAVKHIKNIHKYARKSDIPDKTMFIITTDGQENSSRKYSYNEIKCLIEAQKEKGWEFIFLGANIDAVSEAHKIGISPNRAAEYYCDEVGTDLNFKAMHTAITSVMNGNEVDNDWDKDIKSYCIRRKSM